MRFETLFSIEAKTNLHDAETRNNKSHAFAWSDKSNVQLRMLLASAEHEDACNNCHALSFVSRDHIGKAIVPFRIIYNTEAQSSSFDSSKLYL